MFLKNFKKGNNVALNEEQLDTHSVPKGFGLYAYLDAEARSKSALTNRPDKFDSSHLAKVAQLEATVRKFFSKSKKIYITHREDGLFTVVKVDDVIFPNWLKRDEKDQFEIDIQAIGAIPRNHKNTSARSYKIKC